MIGWVMTCGKSPVIRSFGRNLITAIHKFLYQILKSDSISAGKTQRAISSGNSRPGSFRTSQFVRQFVRQFNPAWLSARTKLTRPFLVETFPSKLTKSAKISKVKQIKLQNDSVNGMIIRYGVITSNDHRMRIGQTRWVILCDHLEMISPLKACHSFKRQ